MTKTEKMKTIPFLGAAWAWVVGSTPRWATLALVLYLGATAVLSQAHYQTQQCEARVESRSSVRGAFIGIYDYVDMKNRDEGKPPAPSITDLRAKLDKDFPALDTKDC